MVTVIVTWNGGIFWGKKNLFPVQVFLNNLPLRHKSGLNVVSEENSVPQMKMDFKGPQLSKLHQKCPVSSLVNMTTLKITTLYSLRKHRHYNMQYRGTDFKILLITMVSCPLTHLQTFSPQFFYQATHITQQRSLLFPVLSVNPRVIVVLLLGPHPS